MNKPLFRVFTVCFVVLLISILTVNNLLAAPTSIVEASFIDVGQGDSALIRDPNDITILIDGGKTSAGPTVVAYLHEQGVDHIDYMIASHADSDHIGGLIDVLNSDIHVQQVYYNGYSGDTATWYTFETAVAVEGDTLTPLQFPAELNWGSTTAYILNPIPGQTNPDSNDVCVVFRLDYGNTRFLFTGDIDSNIEATIIARATPIAAQILKVSHHGSAYSTSNEFLAAAQPQDAIISVGPNSYGHPSPDTIARLQAAGANIYRTDELGTILVYSDGVTYSVNVPLATGAPGSPIYLPFIIYQFVPTPTPTQTPTPTPTIEVPTNTPEPSTAIPTQTTTPTSTPTSTSQAAPTSTFTPTPTSGPVNSGNVDITTIFYDGTGSQEPDEYVQIVNNDTRSIQLQNWTLRDDGNHVYTFPSYVMQPGQTCRVYTNQNHPEYCGFNYGSGSAIWNNSGDCAYLRDAASNQIDQYCY